MSSLDQLDPVLIIDPFWSMPRRVMYDASTCHVRLMAAFQVAVNKALHLCLIIMASA